MKVYGIIDKIEDDVALIILDDDKKINIPIKYLPSNISEEDIIDISLNVSKEKNIERVRKLKKLIDESRKED